MNIVKFAFWGAAAYVALKAIRQINAKVVTSSNNSNNSNDLSQKIAAQSAVQQLQLIAQQASAAQESMKSLVPVAAEPVYTAPVVTQTSPTSSASTAKPARVSYPSTNISQQTTAPAPYIGQKTVQTSSISW